MPQKPEWGSSPSIQCTLHITSIHRKICTTAHKTKQHFLQFMRKSFYNPYFYLKLTFFNVHVVVTFTEKRSQNWPLMTAAFPATAAFAAIAETASFAAIASFRPFRSSGSAPKKCSPLTRVFNS